MKKIVVVLVLVNIALVNVKADSVNQAPWISYPSANVTEYGIYHFRKVVELNEKPQKLIIHLSADNRYNLFVNGQRVCYGPAKGDFNTYKYDVIDIAPYLVNGKNQLAALVYNGGKDKPVAFLSAQTAFFMKAENKAFNNLNTDESWKVYKNPAYQPISYYEMLFKERWFYGFYACGPGDNFDANKHPWGWEQLMFDDKNWKNAEVLSFEEQAPWKLTPRNIPFMDNHLEYPSRIRRTSGLAIEPGNWKGDKPILIPQQTIVTILVDFDIFTMGYPELTISGGAHSSIKLKYAEALYDGVHLKSYDRELVKNKTMYGVWDLFQADGQQRTFRPLWKRAFRYVELNIETNDDPLEILSLVNEYSGYPYPQMATFESDDQKLNSIFKMCQQTLRMCSGETYYDTPFYEQLSYGGDNRPIAAISTYNSTDDRLLEEVLRLYPQSENKETGLFKSAYPSRFDFDMGSWSLAWIQTLHDYYFMRGDTVFVKQFIPKTEGVLGFFHRHMDEKKGILGAIKCQNFMDWSISKGSLPRKNEQGIILNSTMLTLYYVHTLDCTVKLYRQIGESALAEKWAIEAQKIKLAVKELSYNEKKELFTDYPEKEVYSQHTNLLAILCDVIPADEQKELMTKILEFKEFDEYASSYFSYFLFLAMKKTGMEELLLTNLDFWENFLERNYTTCGETGFASHDRSDCHAWSAHPAYFILSIICGINPADIGFNKVEITPHMKSLSNVKATMPHPKGSIRVLYKQLKNDLQAVIQLPDDLSGTIIYLDQEHFLNPGANKLTIKNYY